MEHIYVPGKQNVFANYLSRTPEQVMPTCDEMVEEQVLLLSNENLVNADSIACETRKDPALKQVLQFTKNKWPLDVSAELLPYYLKRFELTVQDDVLLWDSRVLVPLSLQDILLTDLHSGMVRMNRLARLYLWWPNLDKKIEETVKSCVKCQETAKKPPQVHGT